MFPNDNIIGVEGGASPGTGATNSSYIWVIDPIDGTAGDHVLLAPPFIITNDEIDMLVERLAMAISATIK
jgi:acetylornithine/succinyldiaminopimelate/putrescine aminotransferase